MASKYPGVAHEWAIRYDGPDGSRIDFIRRTKNEVVKIYEDPFWLEHEAERGITRHLLCRSVTYSEWEDVGDEY